MSKEKCKGKRRQTKNGVSGVYNCQKKAVGTVETQIGLTQRTPVCDSDECFASITEGYPAVFTAIKQ
jgi:hypothetical protein